MKKILRFGLYYPKVSIVFVLFITLVASFNLQNLRVEITAEGMMVEGDPTREFYQKSLKTFGSDNITIIYLSDSDLFSYEKLISIQKVVNQLNKSSLIEHTSSLFSIRHIRTIDGYTYTDPYLKNIPKSQDKLKKIQQNATKNPLIAGNLLSDNGKTMAINVYFNTEKYYRGFDKEADKLLNTVLAPLKKQLGEVFYIGDPYVRTGINKKIQTDQISIIPISIVILVITLAVSLRRFQAALLPILTAGISIIWILSLMSFLDIPVNIMTSIIPVLLIIIGSTEDIHLLTEYNSALHYKKNKEKALDIMTNNMGVAVMLTFVTTYLGFLSIATSDLGLLKQFGLIASAGLLFNFIITVLLIPAILKLSTDQLNYNNRQSNIAFFQKIGLQLTQYTINNSNKVIITILLVFIASIYFAKQVNVNNNVMDYFDENSTVTTYTNKLHENLSGIQSFSIILSGNKGIFKETTYLQELWEIQKYLNDATYYDNSYSFADFIAVVHTGLDSEGEVELYLPDRAEIVNEYISFIGKENMSSFVSEDFSQARIFVRHNISSSEQLNRVVDELKQYINTWSNPNLQIDVTGESYLNSQAIDYMIEGQFYSLILIFSVIFIMISLLFMNIKAGLIAVLSNLLPIIVLFGVMGMMKIPMNIGTAMIAAISLGVCVDYTMHFMVRYHRLSRLLGNQTVALLSTVREESVPIISTVLSLAAGFLALSLSDFPPVAYFGQLSALVMFLALLSTFIITAMMLNNTRLITVWDVLNVQIKSNLIESCKLFHNMKAWQVRKIIAISEIREFKRDEPIVLQNKIIRNMYVVLEGEVESWRTRKDASVYNVGITKYGGVFGMMFPDSGRKCSSNMIASCDTKVLILKWNHLQQITKLFPRLATLLYKNVSIITSNMLKTYEAQNYALIDEFSGAYNATFFNEILESYVIRANRYEENFSLIKINTVPIDIIGKHMGTIEYNLHAKNLVQIIESALRTPDMIGRFSENEYWIALPTIDEVGYINVVKRLNHLLIDDNQATNSQLAKFLDFDIKIEGFNLTRDETYKDFIHRLTKPSTK